MTTQPNQTICSQCGEKGSAVEPVTLRSLLTDTAQARISEAPYRYCGSERCDVVYFAQDGDSVFRKDELTVRVGVKELSPPRHVCYCFDHTIEEIEDQVQRTGTSTVLDDIKTRMKGGCRNVSTTLRHLRHEFSVALLRSS